VIVQERALDDDLVGEITGVLGSMCACLYGGRCACRWAWRVIEAAGEAA
jgi:predicted site-specific integrase-resolvase